jgi:hypothetical protein
LFRWLPFQATRTLRYFHFHSPHTLSLAFLNSDKVHVIKIRFLYSLKFEKSNKAGKNFHKTSCTPDRIFRFHEISPPKAEVENGKFMKCLAACSLAAIYVCATASKETFKVVHALVASLPRW